MSYRDVAMTLFYDDYDNVFIDENGVPVLDIYKYVHPSELMLFKRNCECMDIILPNNQVIELIHPDCVDDESEYYNVIEVYRYNCGFNIYTSDNLLRA